VRRAGSGPWVAPDDERTYSDLPGPVGTFVDGVDGFGLCLSVDFD